MLIIMMVIRMLLVRGMGGFYCDGAHSAPASAQATHKAPPLVHPQHRLGTVSIVYRNRLIFSIVLYKYIYHYYLNVIQ